ncbi:winged helix-turn-helix domain-containing protein [Tsuneonella sp. HG222]
MKTFGRVSPQRDPPERWDLRRLGWHLCRGIGGRQADCRHVLLVDTRGVGPTGRRELAPADAPAWRLLMIGVEEPAERAHLLTTGVAEAMGIEVSLGELEARARRVDEMFDRLPRQRRFGPLTLDLVHRDARCQGRWLALHPREFEVLWRLSDAPGVRVSRKQLLADVWRLAHEPETNSLAVHVSRLRAKLAQRGCENLIQTDPRGGYRLTHDRLAAPALDPAADDGLDRYLRTSPFWPLVEEPALNEESGVSLHEVRRYHCLAK